VWRRHSGIESVQVEQPWGHWLAGAACGTLAIGLALRVYAYHKMSASIGSMSFDNPDDTDAVITSITAVTSQLGAAGDWIAVADLHLFLGAATAVIVLWKVRYRAPWFGITLACLATLYLFAPLSGTLFGVCFLFYYFWNRRSFVRPIPVLSATPHETH
jgi:hypothetical protein